MAKKKLSAKEEVELMNTSAERLAYVRSQIRSREERFKEETDEFYLEEKQLREDILLGLRTMGLKSVGTSSGESYYISKTNDFEVTNPLEYENWARAERCVTVDKKAVRQRLTALLKAGNIMPTFVKVNERETINVRSAKEKTEKEKTEDS